MPAGLVLKPRLYAQFAPGCIFIKNRLHDQNSPQVQMYTPGVYLHRSVYCAYERGLIRRTEYDKIREELEKDFFYCFCSVFCCQLFWIFIPQHFQNCVVFCYIIRTQLRFSACLSDLLSANASFLLSSFSIFDGFSSNLA